MTGAKHVLVVGGGIIGASVAFHLARAGATVTLVEAGRPGGVATPRSWAWINASWGNPETYVRLRLRAMAEWRRVAAEVPGVDVTWAGGLLWDLPAAALAAYVAEHDRWGCGVRLVGRGEAARIEPALADPPALAAHVPGEGAVEPEAAALALVAAAVARGATVVPGRRVDGLRLAGGTVTGVATPAGPIAADAVVVAAGAGSAELVATAGFVLPMTAPPGLLVTTRPLPRILNGLVMAPDIHVRQRGDGRLIAGSDFTGTTPGDDPGTAAAEIGGALRRLLRADVPIAVDGYAVGHRPTPRDGFPVVGRVPGVDGLWLATMHSGITLAPAIGALLAVEILGGRRDPLLDRYGPDRFGPDGR